MPIDASGDHVSELRSSAFYVYITGCHWSYLSGRFPLPWVPAFLFLEIVVDDEAQIRPLPSAPDRLLLLSCSQQCGKAVLGDGLSAIRQNCRNERAKGAQRPDPGCGPSSHRSGLRDGKRPHGRAGAIHVGYACGHRASPSSGSACRRSRCDSRGVKERRVRRCSRRPALQLVLEKFDLLVQQPNEHLVGVEHGRGLVGRHFIQIQQLT